MSKWLEDAGHRMNFYRVALLLLGACTLISLFVAFLLFKRNQVGALGAVGVVLLGPIVAALLTGLVWAGAGATSRGLVTMMTGAGNIKRAPSFSRQESLVARGQFAEAEESYREHLLTAPGDLDARLALAALVRDQVKDRPRAERLFLEIRTLGPTPAQEFAIANALIDLYRVTEQRGRELAELARFADRYRDTEAGRRAREALRRLKAETE